MWARAHIPWKWAFQSVRGFGHRGGPVPAPGLCAWWVCERRQACGAGLEPTLVLALVSDTK